jgi:dTDP-4-amino-4,6-dideoxygalactose transaminase
MNIPFNRPSVIGRELEYMSQAVALGHASGDGEFTRRCHDFLEKSLAVKKALLTTSCTHALEMTALLLNLQPGDEVIVPAFTFVSTINAFVLRGAVPRFVDVRADTFNFDETQLETCLNKKTKAAVVVHYAGVACEMDQILKLSASHNIPVIEDNAHGLFGNYRGKPLGSIGTMATLSFHETKNFSCGEGGALLLNDTAWIERSEILREKGTNRKNFLRGQVDKYTWVDIGSSYLPSDLLAAFLFAQLESRTQIQTLRASIWNRYAVDLYGWAEDLNIRLPYVPADCIQSHHMFYLILPNRKSRDKLIHFLKERDIMAVFHYQPLNRSDMARDLGCEISCPVAEMAGDCLLRLPFYTDMREEEICYVIKNILEFKIN